MSNILIIDDDVAGCRTLQLHFNRQGHKTKVTHTADSGLSEARSRTPDVIILDIHMPGRSGLDVLPDITRLLPDVPVLMITAFDDMDSTIQAMKSGARDYIHKPIDIDELDDALSRALLKPDSRQCSMLINGDNVSTSNMNTMVGRSKAMQDVFKTIGLVAQKPVTVLITGESGTGKELVARAIHRAGNNPTGSFVAVNCAAIVETLLESDMFGHEKGAFTGAINRQSGKFELAETSTIFLDEIGDLSPTVQAKLLRVLQEKEYTPVGGTKPRKTNARVIAATNANLEQRTREGSFREDLLYRLKVVTIDLPPLRDRRADILDLVRVLLTKINRELGSPNRVCRIAADVMDAFVRYSWPGNVRELENMLVKATALCTADTVTRELLPDILFADETADQATIVSDSTGSLQDIEKAHIARVLESTNWHRGNTCDILGVSRPRLRRLMHQYGLETVPSQSDFSDQDGADQHRANTHEKDTPAE